MKGDVCDCCGLKYEDFRGVMNYEDWYATRWVDTNDNREYKTKSRGVILRLMRDAKEKEFREHIAQCRPIEVALVQRGRIIY